MKKILINIFLSLFFTNICAMHQLETNNKSNIHVLQKRIKTLGDVNARSDEREDLITAIYINVIMNQLQYKSLKTARFNVEQFLRNLSCDIFRCLKKKVNDKVNNNGQTILHVAVQNSNLYGVAFLLEILNANLNVKDNNGNTPYDTAILGKNLKLIDYFQSSGISY